LEEEEEDLVVIQLPVIFPGCANMDSLLPVILVIQKWLLSGRALRALLNTSTVLAGVVLAGSWFQSLMVLGKNEFPRFLNWKKKKKIL
jgi:hypothetical protein